MNRFLPGNRITLLSNGDQYFPALVRAIDAARETVWFETYIFADDATGRLVAGALIRAGLWSVEYAAFHFSTVTRSLAPCRFGKAD